MSDEAELPVGVRQMLQSEVRSIEGLEALLRLRGEPTRSFRADELAAALGIGTDDAREALEELVHAKLLAASNATPLTFRYAPAEPALAEKVEQLAASYATHRVEVLVSIAKSAMSRVRKGALRTFAEAFRMRGPKKDG